MSTAFNWLRIIFCEHSNDTSGLTKGEEISDWLSNYQLHKGKSTTHAKEFCYNICRFKCYLQQDRQRMHNVNCGAFS